MADSRGCPSPNYLCNNFRFSSWDDGIGGTGVVLSNHFATGIFTAVATSQSITNIQDGTQFSANQLNMIQLRDITGSGWTYGSGCKGSNGTPELSFTGESRTGKTLDANLTGAMAVQAAFLNLGFTNTTPFPLDLSALGAPGCKMYNDPFATLTTVTNATGDGQISIPIPADPSLISLEVFFQWLCIDPQANAIGLTASNGGIAVIVN